MERYTQTLDEIRATLSSLETDWKDPFAERVITFLGSLRERPQYSRKDLLDMLDSDFDSAMTAFQLFIDVSKDEFTARMKAELQSGGLGKAAFLRDRALFADTLDHLLIREAIRNVVNRQYTWKDVILERLKSGRGSAIKGQRRGRALEDFVEGIVKSVFGPGKYETRCSFVGLTGQSTEKADFAIPSKEAPRILIEGKAYGATGSKQTDVLGDVNRIISEKRHDTIFLLVTDGTTWNQRVNDLRKLIQLQNEGYIYRIYTKKMSAQMQTDFQEMKSEFHL